MQVAEMKGVLHEIEDDLAWWVDRDWRELMDDLERLLAGG